MKYDTLPNCTISGNVTSCFKLCKTCAVNSFCGNPNACTSCYPGDNKMSENINDLIFQCSKHCDVIRVRLDDGSYFCPTSKEATTVSIVDETSETITSISKFSKTMEPFISLSSTDTLWIIVAVIVIAGATIIIIIWIIKKKTNVKDEKRICCNQLQQINKLRNEGTVIHQKYVHCLLPNEPNPIRRFPPTASPQYYFSAMKHEYESKDKTSLEVIMNTKDFQKGEKLGGGKYSRVFEGTLRGEQVAIKVALKEGKRNIYKELQIYEKIKHASLGKALGVHFSIENMLFLEKRKCNLTTYFEDYGNTISFQKLKQYSIQIADGMKYLHEKQILHGDLKIDNILVKDEDGEFVEISDFGSAIDLKNDQEPKFNGTVTHTAYEILKNILNIYYPAKPSKASDVWSFAITAWQIFQKTFKLPADFLKPNDIVANYEQGKRLPTPALATEKFWRYIFYQCFDLDPESRPEMAHLHKILINFREDSPCSSTFTV